VALTLSASSLAYWNADEDRWVVEDEAIRLAVGASSADLRLTRDVRLQGGT
jgi:hypothetical protein